MSVVYFTKEITSDSLLRIFHILQKPMYGVAVKISTGEPGGKNFLQPKLIEPLVSEVGGVIVECNTAYGGKRITSEDHWKTIKDHGFMDIAPCCIMDEHGEMPLPVNDPYHIKENLVGNKLRNFNNMIVLSHFKGHAMAGYGGALKNMSIGVASTNGKIRIHTAGTSTEFDDCKKTSQEDFMESMVDADKSVMDFLGRDNIVYINVANNLSVDCDCDAHPHDPEMGDIGIFASLDPVAVDAACIDAVYNSTDEGKKSLIKRIESRKGLHILTAAERAGLGSTDYEVFTLDGNNPTTKPTANLKSVEYGRDIMDTALSLM